MSAPALASVGDLGVLNTQLSAEMATIWVDRDLGWLDFNDRVLAEAVDERVPLLERAKFLAIFTSKPGRVFYEAHGGFAAERYKGRNRASAALRHKLVPMLQRQADCFRQSIVPELARHGIAIRHWDDLTRRQQEEARDYFELNISPAVTPLVIDPANPSFPFLANLSTSVILPVA